VGSRGGVCEISPERRARLEAVSVWGGGGGRGGEVGGEGGGGGVVGGMGGGAKG